MNSCASPCLCTTGSSTAQTPTARPARRCSANTGAVLIGRRTFDIGIEEWRDDACSALGPGWFEHHGEQRVELERTGIVETAAATHLTFRVAR
jgi:hypothetical protein